MSTTEARTACPAGSHLLTITSQEELEFVFSLRRTNALYSLKTKRPILARFKMPLLLKMYIYLNYFIITVWYFWHIILSETDNFLMADGTDEESEGEWVFTATHEQPYLPFESGENVGLTNENCLLFPATSRLTDKSCQYRAIRTVFCESEGLSVSCPR